MDDFVYHHLGNKKNCNRVIIKNKEELQKEIIQFFCASYCKNAETTFVHRCTGIERWRLNLYPILHYIIVIICLW